MMLNIICVYKITNIINNKVYIGSSINCFSRWKRHKKDLRNNKHHSIKLQRSYNKYGYKNFKYEIIKEFKDDITLLESEQYYLNYYKSFKSKYGYNILEIAGNNKGYKWTSEQKLKKSESMKGLTYDIKYGKIKSKLLKLNASKRMKGEKNPMFGKTHCNEYKKIRSDAWSNKNNPKYNTGKKVLQLDENFNIVNEWISVYDASKNLNKSQSQIRRLCKNEKNGLGFNWKFKS